MKPTEHGMTTNYWRCRRCCATTIRCLLSFAADAFLRHLFGSELKETANGRPLPMRGANGARPLNGLFQSFNQKQDFGGHREVQLRVIGQGVRPEVLVSLARCPRSDTGDRNDPESRPTDRCPADETVSP